MRSFGLLLLSLFMLRLPERWRWLGKGAGGVGKRQEKTSVHIAKFGGKMTSSQLSASPWNTISVEGPRVAHLMKTQVANNQTTGFLHLHSDTEEGSFTLRKCH